MPRAAVQAGKLEKREVKPEKTNPGVLRQYKGVTYSKAKKLWLAQSFDEHTGTWRQIHGTFYTQKSAARALADWMGAEDVKDLEKGAKYQLRANFSTHAKAAMGIYQSMPMEQSVPGDLSDLLIHRNQDETLDTVTRHFLIQMKYRPPGDQ